MYQGDYINHDEHQPNIIQRSVSSSYSRVTDKHSRHTNWQRYGSNEPRKKRKRQYENHLHDDLNNSDNMMSNDNIYTARQFVPATNIPSLGGTPLTHIHVGGKSNYQQHRFPSEKNDLKTNHMLNDNLHFTEDNDDLAVSARQSSVFDNQRQAIYNQRSPHRMYYKSNHNQYQRIQSNDSPVYDNGLQNPQYKPPMRRSISAGPRQLQMTTNHNSSIQQHLPALDMSFARRRHFADELKIENDNSKTPLALPKLPKRLMSPAKTRISDLVNDTDVNSCNNYNPKRTSMLNNGLNNIDNGFFQQNSVTNFQFHNNLRYNRNLDRKENAFDSCENSSNYLSYYDEEEDEEEEYNS